MQRPKGQRPDHEVISSHYNEWSFSIAALSVGEHLDPFNHDISGSTVALEVVGRLHTDAESQSPRSRGPCHSTGAGEVQGCV